MIGTDPQSPRPTDKAGSRGTSSPKNINNFQYFCCMPGLYVYSTVIKRIKRQRAQKRIKAVAKLSINTYFQFLKLFNICQNYPPTLAIPWHSEKKTVFRKFRRIFSSFQYYQTILGCMQYYQFVREMCYTLCPISNIKLIIYVKVLPKISNQSVMNLING